MVVKKHAQKVLNETSVHGAIEALKLIATAGTHVALTATDIVATGGMYFPAKWATEKLIDKARGIETVKVVDPDTHSVIKMTGKFEKTPEGLIIAKKLTERPVLVKTGTQFLKELEKKKIDAEKKEQKRIVSEQKKFQQLLRTQQEAEEKTIRERQKAQMKVDAEFNRIHQFTQQQRIKIHERKMLRPDSET